MNIDVLVSAVLALWLATHLGYLGWWGAVRPWLQERRTRS